jgi:hypothetical protein
MNTVRQILAACPKRYRVIYDLDSTKSALPMPVLALGGSGGMGERLRLLMEPLAERVRGGAIEDCGHYVMEEQPDLLAGRLLDLLHVRRGLRAMKSYLFSFAVGLVHDYYSKKAFHFLRFSAGKKSRDSSTQL